MTVTRQLDVLLVIRADVAGYPPTINQANLLARRGLRVGVIDLFGSDRGEASLDRAIQRVSVHRQWQSKLEPPFPGWRRAWNWARFRRAVGSTVRRCRPAVVVAYDPHGLVFVPPGQGAHKTVYHFHELPEAEAVMSYGTRRALKKTYDYSSGANLVTFSDTDRARLFADRARLSRAPMVAFNCPARMHERPQSSLAALLARERPGTWKIVGYVGSIGFRQGLIEAAASMRYWPNDSILVLIGPWAPEVRSRIEAEARSCGALERVIFTGPKQHPEALALLAGVDVGLSMIQGTSENFRYSAGAINKRFEYMALGIPQVTTAGSGVAEIMDAAGAGHCVPPDSPAEIGRAVAALLADPAERNRMGESARRAHLERFNYEVQFEPIADWIEQACRSS